MRPITDTFVLVAPDCPAKVGIVPVAKGAGPTVPALQYELLTARPYALTLADLIYETHVRRAGLTRAEADTRSAAIRAELFAKPHPCMRASALPKRYGWGVHHDARGRIALHAVESAEYRRLAAGAADIAVVAAMRNKRPA
jgi:hypothetical protein